MTWRIRYTSAAKRGLRKIQSDDPSMAREIALAIDDLQYDPYPAESKMRDSKTAYRLKLPPYRVLYVVQSSGLIRITRIEARSRRTYRVRNA